MPKCLRNCSITQKASRTENCPFPVHLIADDFAIGCPVPLFDQYISILREKQISVILLIQSETQLASLYGDGSATTIRNNCDTYVYMGSNDLATAQNISVRANIPLKDILEMPIGSQILFRHGSKPHYGQRYNTFANAEYQNVLREYKKRVAKEFRLRQRVRSGQKSNQKNDDANRRHTAFFCRKSLSAFHQKNRSLAAFRPRSQICWHSF